MPRRSGPEQRLAIVATAAAAAAGLKASGGVVFSSAGAAAAGGGAAAPLRGAWSAGGQGAPGTSSGAGMSRTAGYAGAATLSAAAAAVGARRSASDGFFGSGPGARLSAITRCVATAGTPAATPTRERIDGLLKESKVVVFSKSTCPFCSRAKSVLQAEGVGFKTLELDSLAPEEMQAMQDELREMTGARTVPRVFFDGKCIGGCDDLVTLQQTGKLTEALPPGAQSAGGAVTQFKISKSEQDWANELSREQYYILRQQGTEAPGSHEYNRFMPAQGHFACAGCGLPLYSADSKFRSNCGWPVFDKCYFSEAAGGCHVGTKPEWGALEIVCNRCDSHLGHVFFDAFSPSNPNGERH
uniref:Glutaredoxin-2, mitochondrial n=1 Tax=Alexandrium monilatum TaxID=311494 RepID=A0A6T0RPA4_9DINO